ncbi:hypothetical protein [Methanopyrus kandleri]|uniref:Uncharacterized protein specific for M.kandleri, MK-29 family n=1 Tax=Methanopyrus kandleri (strain AV19 / DSM 6324 / JCM 9639 / NBRC 100938) TaxID=190192 RepID=Q8TVX5_METKA|nr:hypothetical protein [Methanopyrus kandleri]AAM02476.1 Uncharacterized protein specific for M.kandleri, MK-29 family [Methanopyrus kandleri AV19]
MFELAVKAFGLPDSTVTHAKRGLQIMDDRASRGRKPVTRGDYGKVTRGVARLVRHAHTTLVVPGLDVVTKWAKRYGKRPWKIVRNVLEDGGGLLDETPLRFEDLPPGAAPIAAVVRTGNARKVVEEAFLTEYPLFAAMMCAVLEDAARTMLERFSEEEVETYGEFCRKHPGRHGSSFLIGVALWGWLEERTGETIDVDETLRSIEKLARDPVEEAVNGILDVG